jgi:hypothetical protein
MIAMTTNSSTSVNPRDCEWSLRIALYLQPLDKCRRSVFRPYLVPPTGTTQHRKASSRSGNNITDRQFSGKLSFSFAVMDFERLD